MLIYLHNKNTKISRRSSFTTSNIGGVLVKGSPSHIPPLNFAQDDIIKNVISKNQNNR